MAATKDVLTEYDFIVVVDASGSMSEEDMPGNKSRWDHMQETVGSLAREIGKTDADGLGLVIFGGSNIQSFDGVHASKLGEIFGLRSPRGSTPLAEALTSALQLAGKSDKKDFILVITDGVPDDRAAAAEVIRKASHQQETDDALTILFVQVGRDAAATAYLKSLDDDLTGCKFDIVDVKTIEEAENFQTAADLILSAIAD